MFCLAGVLMNTRCVENAVVGARWKKRRLINSLDDMIVTMVWISDVKFSCVDGVPRFDGSVLATLFWQAMFSIDL